MIMSLGEIQEKQLWLPGPLPKIVQTALILPVCTSMSGMCRRYYNIFYRIYIYMSYVYIYVCVCCISTASFTRLFCPLTLIHWCWNCEINWFRGYVARDQLRTGHLLAYNIPKKKQYQYLYIIVPTGACVCPRSHNLGIGLGFHGSSAPSNTYHTPHLGF